MITRFRWLVEQRLPFGDLPVQGCAGTFGNRAARERDVEAAVARLIKHVEVPQRILEGMTDEEFASAVAGRAGNGA